MTVQTPPTSLRNTCEVSRQCGLSAGHRDSSIVAKSLANPASQPSMSMLSTSHRSFSGNIAATNESNTSELHDASLLSAVASGASIVPGTDVVSAPTLDVEVTARVATGSSVVAGSAACVVVGGLALAGGSMELSASAHEANAAIATRASDMNQAAASTFMRCSSKRLSWDPRYAGRERCSRRTAESSVDTAAEIGHSVRPVDVSDAVEPAVEFRRLRRPELSRVAEIDRTERIDVLYEQRGAELVARHGTWSAPAWDPTGRGDHSVAAQVQSLERYDDAGGIAVGAFVRGGLVAIAVVVLHLRPGIAQLAFLHVSAPVRSSRIGSRLAEQLERIARTAGDSKMVVSATPSVNTVQFYLGRGFQPMTEPFAELFEHEPDDVHMCKEL
jgi:GNAT superfamily N-acetyltransferase